MVREIPRTLKGGRTTRLIERAKAAEPEEDLPDAEDLERGELAVAVLRQEVTPGQAQAALGCGAAGLGSSLWRALLRCSRSGLVSVAWSKSSTPPAAAPADPPAPARATSSRPANSRSSAAAPPPPAAKAGLGKLAPIPLETTGTALIRHAILSLPGAFSPKEILERMRTLHPTRPVSEQLVYFTIGKLEKEGLVVRTGERGVYRTKDLPKTAQGASHRSS